MEINKFTDVIGVVTTSSIMEGRLVLLTPNLVGSGLSDGYDFGSRRDLPGVKLPATTTEAAKAKYVVAWPVNNARATDDIVMFITQPSYTWGLRGPGSWEQAGNVPFTATAYLTYPGNAQTPVAIPSGWLALAYDRGVFTVPSGHFVYSASLVTGAPLTAADTNSDGAGEAGKPKYSASNVIAVVERYNSTANTLTFRTM